MWTAAAQKLLWVTTQSGHVLCALQSSGLPAQFLHGDCAKPTHCTVCLCVLCVALMPCTAVSSGRVLHSSVLLRNTAQQPSLPLKSDSPAYVGFGQAAGQTPQRSAVRMRSTYMHNLHTLGAVCKVSSSVSTLGQGAAQGGHCSRQQSSPFCCCCRRTCQKAHSTACCEPSAEEFLQGVREKTLLSCARQKGAKQPVMLFGCSVHPLKRGSAERGFCVATHMSEVQA